MALTINEGKEPNVAKVTVDRRLWLDADGKVVEDGDPAAQFLWAAAGRQVPADEAERVGYRPVSAGRRTASTAPPDGSESEASSDYAEPVEDATVCGGCGFQAKNARGLAAHQRSHDDKDD